MLHLFSLLMSFYITVTTIPCLRWFANRIKLLDIPDNRKLHKTPVPRIGGMGIVAGAVMPILIWVEMTNELKAFLAGIIILLFFGVMDDLSNLNYREKFFGQILAMGVFLFIGKVFIINLGVWGTREIILPYWLAVPLTAFFIIGITNAINLSDGLDGLAGGVCVFIFSTLALLAFIDGRTPIMVCCLAIVGALLAFLRFNTFPASIFMGDTGSQFLGFSAAVICLFLTQSQSTAIARALPLIVLGFPIIDTITVMLERIYEGKSPFKPDLKHFHYRLLKLGFSHKDAVIFIYLIQALMVFLSIQLRYYPEIWVVSTYLSLVGLITSFFYLAHRRGWRLQEGAGIEKLWNRYITQEATLFLKNLSLNYIKVVLPLGLIWLAISSPLKLVEGGMVIFFMIFATLAARFVNQFAFKILFRLTSYALVMYLLLTSQKAAVFSLSYSPQLFHYIFWGSIGFSDLIYLFITRFKFLETNPLDYLILMLVMSIPFLPLAQVKVLHVGLVVGGMIVFLWTSEILIANQKKGFSPLYFSCFTATLILFLRYLVPQF